MQAHTAACGPAARVGGLGLAKGVHGGRGRGSPGGGVTRPAATSLSRPAASAVLRRRLARRTPRFTFVALQAVAIPQQLCAWAALRARCTQGCQASHARSARAVLRHLARTAPQLNGRRALAKVRPACKAAVACSRRRAGARSSGQPGAALSRLPLSVFGRAAAASSYALSTVTYHLTFTPLPSQAALTHLTRGTSAYVDRHLAPIFPPSHRPVRADDPSAHGPLRHRPPPSPWLWRL